MDELREEFDLVKKELISDKIDEIVKKLMTHKRRIYSIDARTVFTCEFQNGKVRASGS